MTAYLINHLRQPGFVNSESWTIWPRYRPPWIRSDGKFIVQGGEMDILEEASTLQPLFPQPVAMDYIVLPGAQS